jgi:multidrug transporter EmrE-like cation transporter
MKLVLLLLLQTSTSVLGMGLLTMALHGRPFTAGNILTALTGWQGISGVAALFVSFVVLGAVVSIAKLSTYIPLSTAMTFAFTVMWTLIIDRQMITIPTIIGMFLIMAGITTIAMGR